MHWSISIKTLQNLYFFEIMDENETKMVLDNIAKMLIEFKKLS
jgi:hypothetical protein